jgi:poly(hydroxyalkanoate) granule-associated protein
MFETLDKMMLAGLGAISMTRERADKIFDDYVSRGKLEKENRTGFTKALMDAADKNRAELENLIAKQVRETMETLNLPTREDVQRIEQKIDELSKRES